MLYVGINDYAFEYRPRTLRTLVVGSRVRDVRREQLTCASS
jgi:hypothetical protein